MLNAPVQAPVLPGLFSLPVALIPESLHSRNIARVLNLLFAKPLAEGELDFLEQRRVGIEVIDARIRFTLSLHDERIVESSGDDPQDLTLRGNLYDFLLLASRREDSDTLFFQRRLKMEGDTELGLEVKNFLDGMDMDSVRFSGPMNNAMSAAIKVLDRFF